MLMYTGNQTTILNEVSFFGKPKNMEKVVNVKILPSEVDCGIVFKRVDLKENNIVKVDFKNAYIENDKLILRNQDGASISNIEPLLASIWAAKIDNLLIEIDGDSIPYIDGTSEPLTFLLTIGKIKELSKNRKIFETSQEIGIRIDDFEISIKPNKTFVINVKTSGSSFEFDNGVLPFKDWLSKVGDNSEDVAKYDIILTIAIIFLSNMFCLFEVEFKNYNKKTTLEFFKNLFVNKPNN